MAKQRTASEDAAITQKIDLLIGEGIEPNRATAAAFRMFREGELDNMIFIQKRKRARHRSLAAAAVLAYAARRKAARKAARKTKAKGKGKTRT